MKQIKLWLVKSAPRSLKVFDLEGEQIHYFEGTAILIDRGKAPPSSSGTSASKKKLGTLNTLRELCFAPGRSLHSGCSVP